MLRIQLLVLAAMICSYSVWAQNRGRCSMRGTCGYTYGTYLPVPCPVDEAPLPVGEESFRRLSAMCPELVAEFGNNLCCDGNQITELGHNLQLPVGVLQNCPSCIHNFRQAWCHLTCSPHQRQFVNVTETQLLPSEPWNPEAPLVESVKLVDFYTTSRYAEETYESCKNVQLTSIGAPAMDILCGPWGAGRCTTERWFAYMGDSRNNYAPFDIRFNFGAAEAPFDGRTIACDEPSPDGVACSCKDCAASCRRPQNA